MKKYLLAFILLHVAVCSLFSQNNYGLRFKSKEVIKKYRTGLDVTQSGPISYKSSFKIKFDISFRKYQDFGYIFRLKELKSNNQIDLICKLDEASPGLYLVLNKRETEAKIDLSHFVKRPTNEWNEIVAEFDAKTGFIKLSFEGKEMSESIKFPANSEFVLAFGVINNYEFDTKEVPYISIREIAISIDNTNKYHWQLNNHDGNAVIDTISKKEAIITNPEWEIYHHSKWKFVNAITLAEKAQIAYDSKKEIIYLICENNKIYLLDLNRNSFDSINYNGSPPVYESDNQVIITENSEIVTYSQQESTVSTFDFEKSIWKPELVRHDSLPKYWHHNKLINPLNNRILTLCGYGFYRYKNDFLCYNDSLHQWEKLFFTGDTIFPRYLSALGKNPGNKFQYYLFGGLGNKSGDQILGTEFYYDLYLIDFKENTVKQLWKLNYNGNSDITPVNSLIVDNVNDCFYTLCYPHHDERTYLQVFRASLSKPGYELLGDSIPYYFNDIQSYADLYYWGSTRKLVAITSSQAVDSNNEIKIYTLQFPPGHLIKSKTDSNKGVWLSGYNLIILFLSLLAVGLLYYFVRKFRGSTKDTGQTRNDAEDVHIEMIKAEPAKASSINLFGGFQVIDRKGKDITYRFSPTLKELFLLMLLYSFNNKKGISSIKIQEILWPDKSSSSAKNNRGVNIKKLRTVLPDIGEIQIDYESPFWKLEPAENVFCDYYYINKALSEPTSVCLDENQHLINILAYLKRGNMLTNIETEWLDKFKGEMSTKIVHFLEQHLQNSDIKMHSGIILEIANVIAIFDQLNETALCYKCKVLNNLGEHSLALDAYTNYAKLYLHVYGEEYKIAFKHIIKN